MRWVLKGCGIFLLTVVMMILLLVSMFIDIQNDKDKRDWEEYRPYLVQQSALYIYNHYEGVERLEYSDFSVGYFELGSHTYNVDILVNGDHEFRLGTDIYSEAIWAYEDREHPIANLPEKEVPTNLTQLPETVIFIDKTDQKDK